MKWLIPLFVLIFFEIVGSFLTGLFYSFQNLLFFLLILMIYAIANVFWLISLRRGSGLARGSLYYAVGFSLFSVIIGVLYFHETISTLKLAGMGLGLTSLVLMIKE